jgi:hypothetical protein
MPRIEVGRDLVESYSVSVRNAALLEFFKSFLATAP